jgi:hypothetical protein
MSTRFRKEPPFYQQLFVTSESFQSKEDSLSKSAKRRWWIVATWMVATLAAAGFVVFWPAPKAVDEYAAWPLFRLLGFAVTWLPVLIIALLLAVWLDVKWRRDSS